MATMFRSRSSSSSSSSSSTNNNINNITNNTNNICLDDLKDTDVVFGTRGNGGNASFIRTLEEKALLYTQLSKFEKMACIKQLINDWDGRFFMLEANGNCSTVRDSSPSSKLYTSVRRMMNYVVKKNETNQIHNNENNNNNNNNNTSVIVPPRQTQRKKREIQKIKPIRQISSGSDRSKNNSNGNNNSSALKSSTSPSSSPVGRPKTTKRLMAAAAAAAATVTPDPQRERMFTPPEQPHLPTSASVSASASAAFHTNAAIMMLEEAAICTLASLSSSGICH